MNGNCWGKAKFDKKLAVLLKGPALFMKGRFYRTGTASVRSTEKLADDIYRQIKLNPELAFRFVEMTKGKTFPKSSLANILSGNVLAIVESQEKRSNRGRGVVVS